MDYAQLLNEVKVKSDREVRVIAAQYGVDLSIAEIRALRPLLDDISFHWLFTGVPETFINKVRGVIGRKKPNNYFRNTWMRRND